MTHEELRDRLLDLAYGELSPGDAREVEEHAAACESCRAELDAIRGTRRVMAALPVEPAPERGERILVAAAREAVRARPPRRAWPRWLWAAPVAAASLAAVVALSLRLGAVRPPDAAHEDPNALRGGSPYATPAAPQAPRSADAASSPAEPPARRSLASPPRAAAKKAEAPPPAAGEPRFATAPDAAPAPAPEQAREGASANAAPPPPAAPPSVAFAAPPLAEAPAPAAPAAPPRPSAVGAAPGAAPGAAAAAGASAARQDLADAEARREAAPARRTAKAMAAPPGREGAPRDRAIAAAIADARRGGVDPRAMSVEVEGPTTLDAWRARRVPVAAPTVLEGRRFWVVGFAAAPGAPPAYTVFVEDGTFVAVASVPAR